MKDLVGPSHNIHCKDDRISQKFLKESLSLKQDTLLYIV